MRTSIHISLPATLKEWVREQTESKGYSTTSEFVRDVLRREQEQQARAAIDQKLIRALESGPPEPLTPAVWDQIRAEGRRRLNKKRGKPA